MVIICGAAGGRQGGGGRGDAHARRDAAAVLGVGCCAALHAKAAVQVRGAASLAALRSRPMASPEASSGWRCAASAAWCLQLLPARARALAAAAAAAPAARCACTCCPIQPAAAHLQVAALDGVPGGASRVHEARLLHDAGCRCHYAWSMVPMAVLAVLAARLRLAGTHPGLLPSPRPWQVRLLRAVACCSQVHTAALLAGLRAHGRHQEARTCMLRRSERWECTNLLVELMGRPGMPSRMLPAPCHSGSSICYTSALPPANVRAHKHGSQGTTRAHAPEHSHAPVVVPACMHTASIHAHRAAVRESYGTRNVLRQGRAAPQTK